MIRFLKQLVDNFYLHIQINTANLPYWKLPRPYKSNPVSKIFRKLFEQQTWIRRIVGLNLATVMMMVPLLGQIDTNSAIEPKFEVTYSTDAVISSSETHVKTEPRAYVLPVERMRAITTRFKLGHPGFDISSYVGDDVFAFTSGTVVHIESGTFGFGKYIVLDHGHGLISLYAHLRSFSVELGDKIESGEKIGEIGMTGYTTGPHLHFEIHDNGVAVDPKVYLNR